MASTQHEGNLVTVALQDLVSVITLDNPPVNCLSLPLRRQLIDALQAAENDSDVHAVVLTGASNFSAGADLGEFDQGMALSEPNLHLTIAGYLDRMTTPVVAAITGAALGGGLELALACHGRVATPDAVLGLPETTLGLMPGAGGTQRLPRAIGLPEATQLILSGTRISGKRAFALGLVNRLADQPTDAAITLGRTLAGNAIPRLRDVTLDNPQAAETLTLLARSIAEDPNLTNGQRYAAQALVASYSLGFDDGLATEYQLFTELVSSQDARSHRQRFTAQREARRAETHRSALWTR